LGKRRGMCGRTRAVLSCALMVLGSSGAIGEAAGRRSVRGLEDGGVGRGAGNKEAGRDYKTTAIRADAAPEKR